MGVLLTAVWLIGSAWVRTAARNLPREPISSLIPQTLARWSVVDLPLGPTEAVSGAAESMLQFDEYVYRRFSQGSIRFSIYVAYWGPEKMAVGEVAKHTPDICWPLNGIPRLSQQHRVVYRLGAIQLKEGETRLFGAGAERIHVIYWHLVNGKILDHSQRVDWSLQGMRFWVDTIQRLWTDGRAEQYLVRVDSNVSIDNLMQEPDFAAAFGGLKNVLQDSEKTGKSKR